MFLCGTGRRLSAAALDQVFKSAGFSLVRVRANTQTLRTERAFHRCFCAPARGVYSTPVHLRKQKPEQILDLEAGFVRTDWAHWDRVSAVALSLSRSAQRGGGLPDIIKQDKRRVCSSGGLGGKALLTGDCGVYTRTMQTRSASTAAATEKKREPGVEQPADSNKEDEQNLKEAVSTSSSSTAKAPEEPQPDEGKPSKTQQLKKVFKEYGAVGVCFHVGISLMSLGMSYLLVSSGIDMAAILCKLGFSEAVVRSKMAAGTSTFVLAYAIHKLFAPARISITLVSVPLIVRYFRKTGLFKPPTPAP